MNLNDLLKVELHYDHLKMFNQAWKKHCWPKEMIWMSMSKRICTRDK